MSSNCGSRFGLYLKKAGYDALILSGRCKTHRTRDDDFSIGTFLKTQ